MAQTRAQGPAVELALLCLSSLRPNANSLRNPHGYLFHSGPQGPVLFGIECSNLLVALHTKVKRGCLAWAVGNNRGVQVAVAAVEVCSLEAGESNSNLKPAGKSSAQLSLTHHQKASLFTRAARHTMRTMASLTTVPLYRLYFPSASYCYVAVPVVTRDVHAKSRSIWNQHMVVPLVQGGLVPFQARQWQVLSNSTGRIRELITTSCS